MSWIRICWITILGMALLSGTAMAFAPPPADQAPPAWYTYRPGLLVTPIADHRSHRDGPIWDDPVWDGFLAEHGPAWDVALDHRSGRPELIQGQGIPWIPGKGNSLTRSDLGLPALMPDQPLGLEVLEQLAWQFLEVRPDLLRVDPSQLEFSVDGSLVTPTYQVLRLNQVVDGIPVWKSHVFFRINNGNLIQFGAHRYAPVTIQVKPDLTGDDAFQAAADHLEYYLPGPARLDRVPELEIRTVAAEGAAYEAGVPFQGSQGAGYDHVLIYRLWLSLPGGERPEVMVDAGTGEILFCADRRKFAVVDGGIYPRDNSETEVVRPFPRASVTNGGSQVTDSGGNYDYSGGTATCTLNGQYVRANDSCGSISLSTSTEPGDLHLGSSAGDNCTTPGVGGGGNTHASRNCFYHIDKFKAKARAYRPRNWLDQKITANVNINLTCNAYWDGSSVNFYRSGDGCANTGEIAGVFIHETSHGLDENDGNGFSADPGSGEAYADTGAFLSTHVSCVGHNFRPGQPCSFGCDLSCTGVRDVDTAQEITVQNIASAPADCDRWDCPYWFYEGPMGYEGHCESLIASQAWWDAIKAVRLELGDPAGWTWADRIFFLGTASIDGAYQLVSGGQCNPGATVNGCGSSNYYTVFLGIDDDDGNLANGTPHGCRIWTAFDLHGVACGSQPACYTGCPDIPAPVLSASSYGGQANLSWTASTGAAEYQIFRNDVDCTYSWDPIATVSSTSYSDLEVALGVTYYYMVQGIGSDENCRSAGSNCASVEIALGPSSAGTLEIDGDRYSCSDSIAILLGDADLTGAGTHAVIAASSTEPAGEAVTLTEGDPGMFAGSISTQEGAPGADGTLQVSHGDIITITYEDADHGGAGAQTIEAAADTDCAGPIISAVEVTYRDTDSAVISWLTDEPSSSRVRYGTAVPPADLQGAPAPVLDHALEVDGLDSCTWYYFSVESIDPAGNSSLDDNGGAYYGFVTFEEALLLEEPMDSDPGWAISGGQWAWGSPNGGSGDHGAPDPTSGSTGSNVYGYNLNGGYANSIPEYHLTTPSIDCSGAAGVTLTFQRWLGVERAEYDHAYLRISTNGGSGWQEVWTNDYSDTMDGGSWEEIQYDLSTWADGQSDVRLRWTMGSTDTGWTYCGWNIDDVVLMGAVECNLPTPTPLPTNTPEPTGTATPEPTATPSGGVPYGIRLDLPSLVHPGEEFWVTAWLDNPDPPKPGVPTFLVLAVHDEYFFWPSWARYAPPDATEIDYRPIYLETGSTPMQVIPAFTWPDTGSQAMSGLYFYGAFLNEAMTAVDGQLAAVEWGFGPAR